MVSPCYLVHFWSNFDRIVIKVAGNQDRHKSSDEFDFGPDQTTLELLALEWRKFYTFELEYHWGQLANLEQIVCVASLGVGKGCIMFWDRLDQNSGVHGYRKSPLTYNGENGVSIFSRLLLIWSFLYLQVTRTCIKSQTSSNFGQIGPLTTELAALIMGKWCLHASSFIFYQIIIKVAGNQDRHKILVKFDFGPNQTTYFGVTCPWVTKISHIWTWISLKPVGQSWSNCMCSIIGVSERLHKIWGRLDRNSGFHGNRKPPLTYNGENDAPPLFSVVFDPIRFILAGNEDMHKILDKFEFWPDWTTDYGVSCLWGLKKFP